MEGMKIANFSAREGQQNHAVLNGYPDSERHAEAG